MPGKISKVYMVTSAAGVRKLEFDSSIQFFCKLF